MDSAGARAHDPSARERERLDFAVAFAALALLALWDLSGLDLLIVRAFGNAGGFPLQDAFVPSMLLHEGGRWISYLLFAWVLVNAVRPLPSSIALPREQRWYWFGVTIVCLALTPTLKYFSLTSCPWDLAEFGGRAQNVSHWRFGVADGGPGRCFPAGHASGAFGFIGGYLALRSRHAMAARRWLTGVLALGVLFGITQTARGAHYPSHSMYTAWLCWTASAFAYHWRPWRSKPAASPGSRA